MARRPPRLSVPRTGEGAAPSAPPDLSALRCALSHWPPGSVALPTAGLPGASQLRPRAPLGVPPGSLRSRRAPLWSVPRTGGVQSLPWASSTVRRWDRASRVPPPS
eukprot:8330910-Alexandrium_andersonii.AAC.1